ncbi:tRNA-specific adenosine-34 deaminase [Cutibacterium acnes JCM 18918]|nr:tRNA-specific adenosine-34 deaminase [Cutibacterium acnes JCM 18918]
MILGANGEVLSEAGNERERTGDPTAHAEVLAIRRAAEARDGWRLGDCTLVVTLEPCTCAPEPLLLRGSREWFFGAFDPKAGAVSSLFDAMRDPRLPHRPKVVTGVMAEESSALLREFFDGHRACTVDG